MIASAFIKEVAFEEVKKELLLSDRGLEKVLPSLEGYYESLKKIKLSSEPQENKIQVSREYFDISYLVGEESKDIFAELTTFVPVESILASQIAEEDLVDLEKPLIVAGLLMLLTFQGTCFSEEERQAEVERLKQHLEEVKA